MGISVGTSVGEAVGLGDGITVGKNVGRSVGSADGRNEGGWEGANEGTNVGRMVVGEHEGGIVITIVGALLGLRVGAFAPRTTRIPSATTTIQHNMIVFMDIKQ